jgi:hypothetical protein
MTDGVAGEPAGMALGSPPGPGGRGSVRVTPENVLVIRNVVLSEATLLYGKVRQARKDIVVGEPGQDPVSQRTAAQANPKIQAMLAQCQAYVDELATAADQLGRTARGYGYTEQHILDSFTRYQGANPVPTTLNPVIPA